MYNNKNKYHNIKTEIDGIKFDSKREANRFQELLLLQKAGQISDLRRQEKFCICPKYGANKRARYYIADFTYIECGKKIIEDVKSSITKQNPVYSLKKALMNWQYPEYTFRETF